MSAGALAAAPTVAIVGGGLAGLAAAVALGSAGCAVQLFEARRSLGGRASSFRDPATGELVDQCQHVGMGCCTNLADFCARTGVDSLFQRDKVLHFIAPDGRVSALQASRWLPAPLHLATGFWRLKFLSTAERLAIGQTMWKLLRQSTRGGTEQPTIGKWLAAHGQSVRSIELFWNVILQSALGEELDRASLSAARKVLVDGFMASREAYELEIPRAPLGQLYGKRLEAWFQRHGARLRLSTQVAQVSVGTNGPCVRLADGGQQQADFVVVAVPWSKVRAVVDASIAAHWPWLEAIERIEGAPITAVHLWFDRPITDLPHAVLVGRLSQWMFQRGQAEGQERAGHYYQIVISASRQLAGRDRQAIIAEVCAELAAIWPLASTANLLTARVVTESQAVFSAVPGLEEIRPDQETRVPGVLVAGDWTATGWPATMESAVRSGYLAAEAILRRAGRPQRFLAADLPRGRLVRWLFRP